MSRWIRFFIAIIIGSGLGLAVGWFVLPLRNTASTPDTLRIDYKTDYVLMVAEAYQDEGNLQLAIQRLASLGNISPNTAIEQAIEFAQKAGYTEPDIARMQTLLSALQTIGQDQGGTTQ